MNGGAVITNHDQKLKIGHVFGDAVMPKFAVLNPKFTFSLPKQQMVAGIYDIFNHICEQYFSGEDDNTSDYISEALMKSVIHSSRIAMHGVMYALCMRYARLFWNFQESCEKCKKSSEIDRFRNFFGPPTDCKSELSISAKSILVSPSL